MQVSERFGAWRREVVPDEVAVARVFVTCRTPVFGSDGYYPSSLCAGVLGAGRGSRLHRSLVREQQVASEATAYTFDLAKGSDLFIVDATARPGVSGEALERAVALELDELNEYGLHSGELERVAALTQTEFLGAMQTVGERADQLSRFATYLGDPRLLNEHIPRYRAVTRDQVTRFARERLGADNRASLIYVPQAGNPGDEGSR